MVHPEIISVLEADDAGESHDTGHAEVLYRSPVLASVLADRISHVPIGAAGVDGSEHEQAFLARLIRQPVDARAIDEAFPLFRCGRMVPGQTSVVAEADVCGLASVALRPGADHGPAVFHQDGRGVAVVVVGRTGRDDDLVVRPSGKVRPGQIGSRPLCRRYRRQRQGKEG